MANPRLLLFGTPGAGKSSLLGALAQAASTQAALLKGELVGASSELIDLQKDTYQTKLTSTTDLTAYDIKLQPVEGTPLNATLLDCSGESAKEMLQSKQPFADSHPMQKPILDADGVLLIVDASLSGKQLGEEFQQFARWLKQFHETRGKRTEVGELPVYVVLTKCDILAKANDTSATWMQRIEEGKRRVDQKFREYLKEHGTGFGSIQLHVWATAIKRPALADRPAKTQEPYGVAELFRQCLHSAAEYDMRQATSQGRLHNVVVGLVGLVTVLALAVGLLVQFQPETKQESLDEALQAVMPSEDAKPADRLRGTIAVLEKKLDAIAKIETDFGHLSSKTREELTKHKNELTEYLQYYHEEKKNLKLPYKTKDEKEFIETEKKVKAFAFPEGRAEEWQETPLGKRVKQLRDEYAAMNAELDKEAAWMRAQTKKNLALDKEGRAIVVKLEDNQPLARQEAEAWQAIVQKQPPSRMPAKTSIEGVSLRRYESLSKFQRVKDARKDLDKSKNYLIGTAQRVQDLL